MKEEERQKDGNTRTERELTVLFNATWVVTRQASIVREKDHYDWLFRLANQCTGRETEVTTARKLHS